MILTHLHKGTRPTGNPGGVHEAVLGTEQTARGDTENKWHLKPSICPRRGFMAGVCLSLAASFHSLLLQHSLVTKAPFPSLKTRNEGCSEGGL